MFPSYSTHFIRQNAKVEIGEADNDEDFNADQAVMLSYPKLEVVVCNAEPELGFVWNGNKIFEYLARFMT